MNRGLKDHEIRELVNVITRGLKEREPFKKYGCLREIVSGAVFNYFSKENLLLDDGIAFKEKIRTFKNLLGAELYSADSDKSVIIYSLPIVNQEEWALIDRIDFVVNLIVGKIEITHNSLELNPILVEYNLLLFKSTLKRISELARLSNLPLLIGKNTTKLYSKNHTEYLINECGFKNKNGALKLLFNPNKL